MSKLAQWRHSGARHTRTPRRRYQTGARSPFSTWPRQRIVDGLPHSQRIAACGCDLSVGTPISKSPVHRYARCQRPVFPGGHRNPCDHPTSGPLATAQAPPHNNLARGRLSVPISSPRTTGKPAVQAALSPVRGSQCRFFPGCHPATALLVEVTAMRLGGLAQHGNSETALKLVTEREGRQTHAFHGVQSPRSRHPPLD